MIQAVEERQDRERKSWEEYISEGINARELKDNSQWVLGDLAKGITTDYGDDTIGKFAYAISIPKKRLMNYRTVSTRFNNETREKYKKLSFSHFEAATPLEKPEAWLEKADDDELSVENMKRLINEQFKETKPANLNDEPPDVYRCPECGLWRLKDVSTFEICKGHYEIKEGSIEYK